MKENVAPGQRLMAVVYAKLSSCRRHSGTHSPKTLHKSRKLSLKLALRFFLGFATVLKLLPAAGNSFVQKQNGALPVAKFTCHSTKVCSPKLTSASASRLDSPTSRLAASRLELEQEVCQEGLSVSSCAHNLCIISLAATTLSATRGQVLSGEAANVSRKKAKLARRFFYSVLLSKTTATWSPLKILWLQIAYSFVMAI